MDNQECLDRVKEVVAPYRGMKVLSVSGGTSLGIDYLDILDELGVNMPNASARTSVQAVAKALKEQETAAN